MLRRIEVFGESLTEHFVDRADGVEKRTLLLQAVTASDGASGGDLDAEKLEDGGNGKGDGVESAAMKAEAVRFRLCLGGDPNLECSVIGIEQQYGQRDGDGDAQSQSQRDSVRMLSIDVVGGEYAVHCHYGANRILSAKCSFHKESGSVIGWK